MIKTLKIIGIVVFVLLIAACYIMLSDLVRLKADRDRLQYNQQQLMSDTLKYIKITQSLEEFKRSLNKKIDSILSAEKIRPRQVTSVIERTYVYRDTSYTHIAPNAVDTKKGRIFPFLDVKDCFRIQGYMTDDKGQPSLIITDRQYHNSSIDIAYIEREKKFLFIRYGKWRARLKQINKCGDVTTKEIEVQKDKKHD